MQPTAQASGLCARSHRRARRPCMRDLPVSCLIRRRIVLPCMHKGKARTSSRTAVLCASFRFVVSRSAFISGVGTQQVSALLPSPAVWNSTSAGAQMAVRRTACPSARVPPTQCSCTCKLL